MARRGLVVLDHQFSICSSWFEEVRTTSQSTSMIYACFSAASHYQSVYLYMYSLIFDREILPYSTTETEPLVVEVSSLQSMNHCQVYTSARSSYQDNIKMRAQLTRPLVVLTVPIYVHPTLISPLTCMGGLL